MPATCQRLLTWLRLRHKGSALHQLCDEALLAIQAEAHLIELWARGDAAARRAVQHVLPLVLARFPPDRAALAQDAIAQGLDGPDIARLWPWSELGAADGARCLLPPPQGVPTARRTGPRSPLCSPQCRRAASLAGFTGQDAAAHASLAHVAAQLACTPDGARDALRPAFALLLPALQEKFHPHAAAVLPLSAQPPPRPEGA